MSADGTKELGQLLDPLVAGGWIEPETPFPTNRAWILHPQLRTTLAAQAAAERERREHVRNLLSQIGKRFS